MTVSSQTNSVTYAGDGATTEFAVPYYFLADDHLMVISILVSTGEEVVLVLNSEYTVTGEGNPAGGEVTTVVAPAIGRNLEIRRVVPLTQETDYVSNDAFPAESHERALDKLTMIDQQHDTDIATLFANAANSNAKTLRVPENVPAIADALTRANMLLGFDGAGDPLPVAAVNGSATDLEARLRDAVNPLNGSSIVAWGRKSLGSSISTAQQFFDGETVNLWEFAGLVTNKPTPADPSTWDWTPALEGAAAANRAVRIPRIPGVFYRVGDADLPTGTKLIGESVPRYTVAALNDLLGESTLVKFGSATALIRGAGFIESYNMLFHGVDKTTTIYRHSSTMVHIRHVNCGCYGFDRPIGKNEAIGGFLSYGSTYSGNNVGINNIIDSMIYGGFINANTLIGVNLGTGANDNTIVGPKIEFNGTNLSTSNAVGNSLIGGVYDRASLDNILTGAGAEIDISGIQNHRAGSSGSGSNLTIQGSSRVVVNGMITQHGTDDGGGGLDTPTINIDISGACGLVVLNGCDLTGVNGTTRVRRQVGTSFSVGLRINGCPGVQDVVSDGVVVLAAAGGVGTITFNLPPVQNSDAKIFYLDLMARNQTSGAVETIKIAFVQNRGGGAAVLTEQAKVFQVTAGFFQAGAGSISYATGTVATDGSSFVLTLTNNTAASQRINAEIKN